VKIDPDDTATYPTASFIAAHWPAAFYSKFVLFRNERS